MPIKVFSLDEALRNRKSDVSKWPSDPQSQAERLSPLARPSFVAPFKIGKEALIFTVGSCFARNIEKQLAISGFDYAAKSFTLSHDDSDFKGMDVSGVLNKYVVFSILNDLRWALDPSAEHGDDHYVALRGDKWWDPHLNNVIAPSSRERVVHRRTLVRNYFKTAADAGVFIMTLGLAEAWFDTKTKLYANGTPPATIRLTEPDRFEFHLLDYNQILEALDEIHAILVKFGKPDVKILVTVSPVALKSTFSGEDSMVANTYSKSVQRAAVAAFVARHDNVAYFPSYESVVLSERSHAWAPDQLHASDEVVRYNVLAMMDAYVERDGGPAAGVPSQAEITADALKVMYQAEEADREGRRDEAAALYRSAAEAAPRECIILLNHARFLMKCRKNEEAVFAALQSVAHGGEAYGAYTVLATAYRAAERFEEAYAAIDKALETAPKKIGNLHAKVTICVRLNRMDEALDLCERILMLLDDGGAEETVVKFVKLYVDTAQRADKSDRATLFLSRYRIRKDEGATASAA